jgi:predicted RNase H-like HicB family nuclease
MVKAMAIYSYPVILERGEHNFGVYAPDLPGCISIGDTPKESLLNMRKALHLHLGSMLRDGDPIPSSSAIEDLEPVPGIETVHQLKIEIHRSWRKHWAAASVMEPLIRACIPVQRTLWQGW